MASSRRASKKLEVPLAKDCAQQPGDGSAAFLRRVKVKASKKQRKGKGRQGKSERARQLLEEHGLCPISLAPMRYALRAHVSCCFTHACVLTQAVLQTAGAAQLRPGV